MQETKTIAKDYACWLSHLHGLTLENRWSRMMLSPFQREETASDKQAANWT